MHNREDHAGVRETVHVGYVRLLRLGFDKCV